MRNPKAVARVQRTLGVNMKRIRVALGLTQGEAGQRGGLHWRHWQKIEAGQVNVTIATLVGISAALETTLSELFLEGRGET
jgi:transcriptional regulator with XRE-family HTH domain